MVNFLFNDVIKSHKGEYFLRTTTNDDERQIVSSFFRNGTLLTSLSRRFNPSWKQDLLRERTRLFHQQKKKEVYLLLELSERLRDFNRPETKDLLGRAFACRQMHEEALVEFEDAIALDPTSSHRYFELGKSYLATGRVDDAVAALEHAASNSPEYADFHNHLGTAYYQKQSCKKAVDEFTLAIEINPYYAEAHFNLARALVLNAITKEDFSLSIDCQQKARYAVEKAIKICPTFQSDDLENGIDHLQRSEYESALQAFDAAASFFADSVDFSFILDFYLRVMYGGKKLKNSFIWRHIQKIEEMIELNPNYADLYNHLGVAYVILGKYTNRKAMQQFGKAMTINPDYENAKRNKRIAEYDDKGMQLLFDAILK